MKTTKYFSIFLFIILCSVGCRDDEYFPEETNTPIDTGVIVEGNLNGLVVNGSNEPVADALVEVRGASMTTDENGFFRFENISLDNNGSLVTISKEGLFTGYTFAYAQPGEDSYIKHMLPPVGGAQFPTQSGSTFPLNDGAEVTIPAFSATNTNGAPYNGRVFVKTRYYDPTDPHLVLSMPGDLRGLNESGDAVQLLTYGMMGLEITSETGEPLLLKESLPATLRFPIPAGYTVQDTIPMWHLDEDTGYWIEEGFAVQDGDFMVAEVTHFSFWNCDAPFPVIELQGQLTDLNGSPLANQAVTIRTDDMMTGTGHTNENGHFRGKVPQGLDLTLSINTCDDQTETENIGSFDVDTNLGAIEISNSNDISISGQLVDCSGVGVQGYVIIETETSFDIFATDINGNFDNSISLCAGTQAPTIKGVSLDCVLSSEEQIFETNFEVNFEEIEICNPNGTQEYLEYSLLGGEPTTVSSLEVTIVDGTHVHIFGESDEDSANFIKLFYPMNDPGNVVFFQIQGFNEDGNRHLRTYSIGNENFTEFRPKIVTKTGDMITARMDNNDITLEMNIIVDEEVQSGKITGNVWNDQNRDGIRDIDEIGINGRNIGIALSVNSSNESFYNKGYADIFNHFPVDGKFTIEWLVPGYEFSVNYSNYFEVSPADQGNDDSIDSDFIQQGNNFITESFFINEGETISDIGLGLIIDMTCQVNPRCCPVDGMLFHIRNGTPPFTVNITSPTIAHDPMEFESEEFEFFTSEFGTYDIVVTDAIVNTCTSTYEHNEFLNALNGKVWNDTGDIPDKFDQNDSTVFDDDFVLQVNLYNDEGSIVQTSFSDSFGRFQFQNFQGDIYRIQVILPTEYEFIALGSASDSNDNHIDPNTGFSHFIAIGDHDADIFHSYNIGIREK